MVVSSENDSLRLLISDQFICDPLRQQWKLNHLHILVTQIIHREASKTAIILKFFIHKLDASLQITVHGQNFFKWKMNIKENQSEPAVPDLIICLLVPENELATERNQSFQHTVQLEKRASLFTMAWLSNLNHLLLSLLSRVLAFRREAITRGWNLEKFIGLGPFRGGYTVPW